MAIRASRDRRCNRDAVVSANNTKTEAAIPKTIRIPLPSLGNAGSICIAVGRGEKRGDRSRGP